MQRGSGKARGGGKGCGRVLGVGLGRRKGVGGGSVKDRNNGADPRVKMRRGGELERIVGLLSIMVNMTWASCYEKAHADSRQHFPLAFWKSDYHNIFIRLSVTDILFLWLSHFSLCFWSRSVLLFNYCQWRLFNLLRLKLNHYSIFKNAFNFLLRAHLQSESFLYVQYFFNWCFRKKKGCMDIYEPV